jgi:hypothetical protein
MSNARKISGRPIRCDCHDLRRAPWTRRINWPTNCCCSCVDNSRPIFRRGRPGLPVRTGAVSAAAPNSHSLFGTVHSQGHALYELLKEKWRLWTIILLRIIAQGRRGLACLCGCHHGRTGLGLVFHDSTRTSTPPRRRRHYLLGCSPPRHHHTPVGMPAGSTSRWPELRPAGTGPQ